MSRRQSNVDSDSSDNGQVSRESSSGSSEMEVESTPATSVNGRTAGSTKSSRFTTSKTSSKVTATTLSSAVKRSSIKREISDQDEDDQQQDSELSDLDAEEDQQEPPIKKSKVVSSTSS
jgi:hypothetical protein